MCVCACVCVCVCVCVYLIEVPILALLPVHHVVEDRDHDVSYFHLRNQRHSQEWTDHPGNEMNLILTCNNQTSINSSFFTTSIRKYVGTDVNQDFKPRHQSENMLVQMLFNTLAIAATDTGLDCNVN